MQKKWIAALCATALVACGGEDHDHHGDDHGHDHEALAADACAHMGEGSEHVDASADRATAANAVSETHQAFHIVLPGADGEHFGAVLFTPEEAGEFAFFTGSEIPFAIYDGETEVPLEESEAIDTCPGQLSTMHLAELELGTQYTLTFGPAPAEEVMFISLYAGDEGHEDHAH